MSPAAVRIRRMSLADLDRVVEIAQSLKDAPHWPIAAYLPALDAKVIPARVALVAESLDGGVSGEHSSGAKAQAEIEASTARGPEGTRSCPDTKRVVEALRATEKSAIVGFAVAMVVGPQAELETIAVAAEGLRRGIGRLLFAALAEKLRLERAEEILLEVRASNGPALGFYRSLGFRETGRRPRYYADPVEDALLLALPLA